MGIESGGTVADPVDLMHRTIGGSTRYIVVKRCGEANGEDGICPFASEHVVLVWCRLTGRGVELALPDMPEHCPLRKSSVHVLSEQHPRIHVL